MGAVENGGEVTRISVVATDVSDRVEREASLRESETRFRVLFESAPEAQVIFDIDEGRIVEANPPACAMFDRSLEAMLGTSPKDLSPDRQPDGRDSEAAVREHIRRVLAGERLDFEWEFRGPGDTPASL